MQTIKYAITDFMSGLRKKKGLPQNNPELLLKAALSRQDFEHARFRYFKNGVLGIEIDSSARLYLLTISKDRALGKLKKRFDTVKDIHFSLGALKSERKETAG